ncbi:DEAD/DEAH box helicase family protein [Telmatobacter bradus]|uniref:DEAD/DEAH box helicase family protein n=1 Tax=Telmatobacter bradus TaxID=474953 RepID=UPI003B4284C9
MSGNAKQQLWAIANRLSLRAPQRESLEILDRLCELLPLAKDTDITQALEAIRSVFPSVTDFGERDFASLCFAIATGVGKTRLMGAFIAYLNQAWGIRHFFVLAPNLTIYNKLTADFTQGSPKYVFQGLSDFAINPPEIITGDNYENGRGIRSADLFGDTGIHVNIFNISKINAEVRGDKEPRIKRLQEYIGESYFEYLSKLDDLVLLMDESHRYRGKAGMRAINELKPILGLELTATPQIEAGSKTTDFKNVIYSYPLASALHDGFVKEPSVATRENFRAENYDEGGLETIKLQDGIRVHEHTKVQLDIYARNTGRPLVKPFMLVVAKDTSHAGDLLKKIEADDFFEGRYKGRVITVHSNQSGEEKDETVQQLLSVEDPANPTEIVIHVNMLKEGWDVTNLYTIVPLRAANSKTLVEQSIGRGLRLPYGKRTGVPDVDRLTIVSHDRFQEIVDHANDPASIIRTGVVIGRDIPDTPTQAVTITPTILSVLGIAPPPTPVDGSQAAVAVQKPLFATEPERRVAEATLQVIHREFERLRRSEDLKAPEVQQKIIAKVMEEIRPVQGELAGIVEQVDVSAIVTTTTNAYVENTIDIPLITVVPSGEVTVGYKDFDLDCSSVHYPPVARDLLIQRLTDNQRFRIVSGDGVVQEPHLENYIVRGLIDQDDISYDDHAQLLYKLAGQLVRHIKSYLSNEDDVRNVLQYNQSELVRLVHTQMNQHYMEKATEYQVTVARGFQRLSSSSAEVELGKNAQNFRQPVEDKLYIRSIVFGGFTKCLYPAVKFDSDPERRFATILEDDGDVVKWLKPPKDLLKIQYAEEDNYNPDFIVETKDARFLCEIKRASEMEASNVQKKAKAAIQWCERATGVSDKPWRYSLIPHDMVQINRTFSSLIQQFR